MGDFYSICTQVTLWWEGGFSDDPDDPGGVTNYGITQNLVDKLKLNFDVRGLTALGAVGFYQKYFWEFYNCELLLDKVVAAKVFDMLVNVTDHAVFMVQSAVNQLYQSQVVVVDGVLGPKTADYINHIEKSQMQRFLFLVKQEQRAFYLSRIAANPVLKKYENGWLRRAYWPYMSLDESRLWPYLPNPQEGWPQGVSQ
jgi:lysozyme family protein